MKPQLHRHQRLMCKLSKGLENLTSMTVVRTSSVLISYRVESDLDLSIAVDKCPKAISLSLGSVIDR